jgi:hypothetical protein
MKILLQNTVSKHFYCGRNTWTSDPEEAFDFQYSRGLADYCDKLDAADTELVVALGAAARHGLECATTLC